MKPIVLRLVRKSLLTSLMLTLSGFFGLGAMVAHAEDAPVKDVAQGQKLYQTNCVNCHGANAEGNDTLGSPALRGQNAAYLSRQLAYFSKGIRGANDNESPDKLGQQMAAMSMLLQSSQARTDVSVYLASLQAPASSVTETKTGGGTANGYKYYQSSCGACHGADATGNERLNAPSLAGLSAAYLKRQYQNYLTGRRGWHSEDKLGRQMRMIANTMTGQKNIDDVIMYIVSLNDDRQ